MAADHPSKRVLEDDLVASFCACLPSPETLRQLMGSSKDSHVPSGPVSPFPVLGRRARSSTDRRAFMASTGAAARSSASATQQQRPDATDRRGSKKRSGSKSSSSRRSGGGGVRALFGLRSKSASSPVSGRSSSSGHVLPLLVAQELREAVSRGIGELYAGVGEVRLRATCGSRDVLVRRLPRLLVHQVASLLASVSLPRSAVDEVLTQDRATQQVAWMVGLQSLGLLASYSVAKSTLSKPLRSGAAPKASLDLVEYWHRGPVLLSSRAVLLDLMPIDQDFKPLFDPLLPQMEDAAKYAPNCITLDRQYLVLRPKFGPNLKCFRIDPDTLVPERTPRDLPFLPETGEASVHDVTAIPDPAGKGAPLIACVYWDGYLRIYNVASRSLVFEQARHSQRAYQALAMPGFCVATCSRDGRVVISPWHVKRHEKTRPLAEPLHANTAADEGVVAVLDRAALLPDRLSAAYSMAPVPKQQRQMLVGYSDGTIAHFSYKDPDQVQVLRSFTVDDTTAYRLAVHDDLVLVLTSVHLCIMHFSTGAVASLNQRIPWSSGGLIVQVARGLFAVPTDSHTYLVDLIAEVIVAAVPKTGPCIALMQPLLLWQT